MTKRGEVRQPVDPIVVAAIERKVQQEDLEAWATREEPEFEPVPGLPETPKVSRGILRVMVLQWLP